MARKAADPSVRLNLLLAARERVAPGEQVSAEPMAKIAGMGWRNMKLLIDSDPHFPVAKRGAEGIAWSFDVATVLDHMIAGCRVQLETANRHAERIARLTGFDAPDASTAALGIGDLKGLVEVNRELQREKVAQGLMVPAAEMVRAIIEYNGIVQAKLLEATQQIDPAGTWPVEHRTAVEDHMRGALVAIEDAAQRWIRRCGDAAAGAGAH